MNQDINKDLIYNTRYVFTKYLKGSTDVPLYYNIPEYQRGYKWTKDNIVQLLEDIHRFKTNQDSFYCLQNITIIPSIIKGRHCYNVIDGQQRLTTLFILLSYLQKDCDEKWLDSKADVLKYSIRTSTDNVLKNDVVTGNIWHKPIDPNEASSKDEYYIRVACAEIDNWFTSKTDTQLNDLLDEFRIKVLDYVVLIINRLDEGSSEENVFANLNGGKVELDGSDLMRAILITRAAKEKFPPTETDYNIETPVASISVKENRSNRVNEYRIRLGMELDEIAAWWSKPDVKKFYTQILPNDVNANKSFRVGIFSIDLLYLAYFEAYKDKVDNAHGIKVKDVDIRFFENGMDFNKKEGDDHYELYTSILQLHRTLKDWFEEDDIYNLLGYLFYNFKGNDVTFSKVWSNWGKCKDKRTFSQYLKNLVRDNLLAGLEVENEGNETSCQRLKEQESIFKNIVEDCSHNWYEEDKLYNILILLDIIPPKQMDCATRLPIDYFKVNSEHREHIRPQTENPNGNTQTDEYNKYLNSIGNLVLLDSSVNEAIGNGLLKDKVQRIVNEYFKKQKYIRPHTFSVYLTKLKDKDTFDSEWTDKEIQDTANDVYLQIATFLSFEAV